MTGAVIAVHGGAGGRPPRDDRPHRAALDEALRAGARRLEEGAPALEAVIAAVTVLEDFPGFNAGVGSVLNRDGEVEMDAAVMCGRTHEAGAVALVTGVRNPVLLADAVRQRSPHVLLAGPAADRQAETWGLELMASDHFVTERERRRWLAGGRSQGPGGTVGAVALGRDGHLAAATSTGGVRHKLPGRIGDSPLPGAGTYADDATCAVSVTGDGEPVIRGVVAHEVAARMRLTGAPLEAAAQEGLAGLKDLGGAGGLIAVSPTGEVTMPFTTPVMFRGVLSCVDGRPLVAVADEAPAGAEESA